MKGYYRHIRSMDLVLEVVKTVYRDTERLKVKGIWWNLGCTGKPWTLNGGRPSKLEIKVSSLKDWRPIERPEGIGL